MNFNILKSFLTEKTIQVFLIVNTDHFHCIKLWAKSACDGVTLGILKSQKFQ